MAKLRVAVLMGGRSAEREVSLSTGRQVLAALDPAKYEALPIDTASLGGSESHGAVAGSSGHGRAAGTAESAATALFGSRRPDLAVICLHGQYGEDGTIQGLLELLDIPYTGSGVLASALAMNKVMAKKMLRAEGVPTPAWITVRGRAEADRYLAELEAGTAAVTAPAVVKPSEQGSTIGITIVQEAAGMAAALETALAFGDEVLVERFIDGMEITGPVIGNSHPESLPLVEIVPSSGFYDYEMKYTAGATEEIVPARLTDEQTRRAQELAVQSHLALGCRGCTRTDMLVAADGIWVLEVNTVPGMTPTSLVPRSAEAAGIAFPQLVDRLIELALEARTHEPTPVH